jgi:uncharacterized protein GlcG (DUF336 family)
LELCQRPRSLAIVAAGTEPADGSLGWCILRMRAVGARCGRCQGAIPVVVDGEVIGGIGASFATPEEDEQIAKAGLATLTQ